MSSTSQLAAIMFADIAGYTAIMSKDVHAAMDLLHKNRDIQKPLIKKHNGRWLKELGDGVLASFDTASDAVNCAIEIQKAAITIPDLRLRIGIHLGEVIFEESDVFGDGVNLASRISDVAPSGKVWISDAVRMSIRSRKGIFTTLADEADLKNVGETISLYEVSDDPDLLGSYDPKKPDAKEPVLNILWARGVPQIVFGYLVVGIIVFISISWLIQQNYLAPAWSNAIILFIVILIPSVIFFAYNHFRWNQGKMMSWEKIPIPLNIIIASLFAFMLFKSGETKSISKTITVKDEFGKMQERTIIKPEYRIQIPLFFFDQEVEDSVNNWMGPGLAVALGFDLDQDENLTVAWPHNRGGTYRYLPHLMSLSQSNIYPRMVEKMKYARLWGYNRFLSGNYRFENDSIYVTTRAHEMPSGDVIVENDFSGHEFFELADRISRQVKIDFGLSEERIKAGVDAPIGDMLTTNLQAYKDFLIAYLHFPGTSPSIYYGKCLDKDSSFAFADKERARWIYNFGEGKYAAIKAIENALHHASRLSEMHELQTKALYYNILDDKEKALILLRMQLDLNPDHLGYKDQLYIQNRQMGKFKENIELVKNETVYFGERVPLAYLFTGRYKKAKDKFQTLISAFPNNVEYRWPLGVVLLATGEFDKYLANLEQLAIIAPLKYKEDHYKDSLQTAALSFLESTGQNEMIVKNLEGNYRSEYKELVHTYTALPNANGMSIISIAGVWRFAFPLSDFKLWHGDNVITFKENINGEIDHLTWKFRDGVSIYYFKQDSIILSVENLLLKGQTENALKAAEEAYTVHPDHYYLSNYMQHLEFIMGSEYESRRKGFTRFTGKYGPHQISIENGRLCYKSRHYPIGLLLPLPENNFLMLESYKFFFKFITRNEKQYLQLHERVGTESRMVEEFEKEG